MSAASKFASDMIVCRSERIAARVVDECAVVIVIDENRLHTLNATGTAIWEHCDKKTVDELADWFSAKYALEADVARRDVDAFLEELHSVGAIEVRVA